jgi:hypothetical protein
MTNTDYIIYGSIIGLLVFVGLLSWYGVKLNKQMETESSAVTFEKLRTTVGSRVLQGPLIWGAWYGVNAINQLRLEVKDRNNKVVTVIWFPAIPTNGVIEFFELDGNRYECVNEGLMSGRAWLRDASTGEIVLSAQHSTFEVRIYRGKTDQLLVHIHRKGFFSELGVLSRGDEKLGHHFYERRCYASVISLHKTSLSVLEQCFTLLSIPRSRTS